jgi:PASTA domain
MRALAVGLVMTMTLGISACGDDDTANDATTDEAATDTIATGIPDIVGDSVEDATATLEAAGLTLRVVQRDGENLAVTADFVENRVNVAVQTEGTGEVVTEVVSTG